MNTTETVINLPNNTIKQLPIPAGKTNVAVTVPLRLGKSLSSPEPDATIFFRYKESGAVAAPSCQTPRLLSSTRVASAVNSVTTSSCPLRCCTEEVETDGCKDMEFIRETVDVEVSCEAGCTYDAKADSCMCGAAAPTSAATCPTA